MKILLKNKSSFKNTTVQILSLLICVFSTVDKDTYSFGFFTVNKNPESDTDSDFDEAIESVQHDEINQDDEINQHVEIKPLDVPESKPEVKQRYLYLFLLYVF